MKELRMAEPAYQSSLAVLIEGQMVGCSPVGTERGARPIGDPYLWTAVGQELRRAWSELARSAATLEMQAAAQRLRERMGHEAAAGALLFAPQAVTPVDDARGA